MNLQIGAYSQVILPRGFEHIRPSLCKAIFFGDAALDKKVWAREQA
jgi:hypothetical protein